MGKTTKVIKGLGYKSLHVEPMILYPNPVYYNGEKVKYNKPLYLNDDTI